MQILAVFKFPAQFLSKFSKNFKLSKNYNISKSFKKFQVSTNFSKNIQPFKKSKKNQIFQIF
jgi:hypothetical protein